MIELCNALKFITMLIFIQNILTFNLGVAFLKSVSIVTFMTSYPSLLWSVTLMSRQTRKYDFTTKYVVIVAIIEYSVSGEIPAAVYKINQRTNDPINAHLIYGPSINLTKTRSGNDLDLQYSFTLFTELVVCIYKFSGHWLHKFLKYPLFSHFRNEKRIL